MGCVSGGKIEAFVKDGPASVERLLGVSGCKEVAAVGASADVTLASQVRDGCASGSVSVWYEVYREWFCSACPEGVPAGRTLFVRQLHQLVGLSSRPNGRRALAGDGRRTVQYRVFCLERASAKPSKRRARTHNSTPDSDADDSDTSSGAGAAMPMTHRMWLDYDARAREVEDFFHFSNGNSVSMTETLSRVLLDRVARYGITKSLRVWDWCREWGRGGIGWMRRKLPAGRYVVEMTMPARDVPLPVHGRDVSAESFLRFSFLLRDVTADHPDVEQWDEQADEGLLFGRHCLLSFGVTLIEPMVTDDGTLGPLREFYVDNPGFFEASGTGFSFDSDTMLAILGDQSAIMDAISKLGTCEVECFSGQVGHSFCSGWLDGEPDTGEPMVLEYFNSCHRAASVPIGMSYGRFGSLVSTRMVGGCGEYRNRLSRAVEGDYDGYVIGDEFSCETGEREGDFVCDTRDPKRRDSAMSSRTLASGHVIPMSDFSR